MSENKENLPPYLIPNNHLTEEQCEQLKGTRLFIGTPMYGGNCTGAYTTGLMSLALNMPVLGMELVPGFIMNESLVQRARNACVMSFLDSSCDYLMFIDADIGFNSTNILEMILASKQTGHKIIGANYSMKTINWPAAIQAWKDGVRPDKLGHCSGKHVVRPISEDAVTVSNSDLYPVKYLGTGFMLIHKSVFEDMKAICEPYRANNAPPTYRELRDSHLYFDCKTDEHKIYMSEDYFFCHNAMKLGIQPQLAMWINLSHLGTYAFEGCYMCSQGAYAHAKQLMPEHEFSVWQKQLKKQLKKAPK